MFCLYKQNTFLINIIIHCNNTLTLVLLSVVHEFTNYLKGLSVHIYTFIQKYNANKMYKSHKLLTH